MEYVSTRQKVPLAAQMPLTASQSTPAAQAISAITAVPPAAAAAAPNSEQQAKETATQLQIDALTRAFDRFNAQNHLAVSHSETFPETLNLRYNNRPDDRTGSPGTPIIGPRSPSGLGSGIR